MAERSKALTEAQRRHDRARDPVRDANRLVLRLTPAEAAALDALARPGETRQAVVRRLLDQATARRRP